MSGFSSIGGGEQLGVAPSSAPQSAGISIVKNTPDVSDIGAAVETQLSPLGQVTSTLGQLQQSDPTKYRQVTQQIAAALQSDAQTAQSEGEIAMAARLSQLASAFTSASQNGQLPDLQDLAALQSL